MTDQKNKRAEPKINVRFPDEAEIKEIEDAVVKLNKEAKDGLVTGLGGFIRDSSLRRAREINGPAKGSMAPT